MVSSIDTNLTMSKLACLVLLANLCFTSAHDVDYAQFVNPFIGSEGAISGYACMSFPTALHTELTSIDGGGDVFVGGAVPFGMVKLGLDTYEEPINQSALNGGWTPQGYVTGVSLMHVSGTGGGPKYGFPAQMPLTSIDGDVNLLDNRTYWQKRVSIVNATQ